MSNSQITDAALKSLTTLVRDAKHIVVFTGAGISTESGIPDFRGPKGVWNTMRPIDFSDFVASADKRRESWRRKFSGELNMQNAAPNLGHIAIAELAECGKLAGIITQNVDGLHQKSGISDDKIIELHGNATYASCLDCSKHFELSWVKDIFTDNKRLPICDNCEGIIKTATISFGQAMPLKEMQESEDLAQSCDLFIAMGSSLVVYPAAGFPMMAKQSGAKLIILNNQSTDMDAMADLVLHHPIGHTLCSLMKAL